MGEGLLAAPHKAPILQVPAGSQALHQDAAAVQAQAVRAGHTSGCWTSLERKAGLAVGRKILNHTNEGGCQAVGKWQHRGQVAQPKGWMSKKPGFYGQVEE